MTKIACGGLHTLVLLTNGEVYSFGCPDNDTLGRAAGVGVDDNRCTTPGRVELNVPIDLISAGDLHSLAANS